MGPLPYWTHHPDVMMIMDGFTVVLKYMYKFFAIISPKRWSLIPFTCIWASLIYSFWLIGCSRSDTAWCYTRSYKATQLPLGPCLGRLLLKPIQPAEQKAKSHIACLHPCSLATALAEDQADSQHQMPSCYVRESSNDFSPQPLGL
jgi:hypothetical protein